jgi:hypothetical protein
MAILLNGTSNLRFRIDLLRRISDGIHTPASLEVDAAVERYEHARPGGREEPGFAPLFALGKVTLLDADLIGFLQALAELVDHPAVRAPAHATLGGAGDLTHPEGVAPGDPLPSAALQPSVDPAFALRLQAQPGGALVEAGFDLGAALEPVLGQRGEAGSDLALFRFFAAPRPIHSFAVTLTEEFDRFPTDPSLIHPGIAE